jgi:hypothetical protein
MMRKTALDQIGGYTNDPARQPPEDYELWSRIARRFRVANLPERLTIYREVQSSMSRTGVSPFKKKLVLLSAENIAAATRLSQPEQIHFDIAALIHDVPDMLSKNVDIAQIGEVVKKAGLGITGYRQSDEVDARVEKLTRHLRHRFFAQRNGFKEAWTIARRIKGGFRRLGFIGRAMARAISR